HIARAVRVGVKAGERRRKDGVVHAALRQPCDYLDTIPVVCGEPVANGRINALHQAASFSETSHAGTSAVRSGLYGLESRVTPVTSCITASWVSADSASAITAASRSLRCRFAITAPSRS